jgi:hypothetical protein
MTAVTILNAVLAVFIVTAILTVLGWGLVKDRQRRKLATPDGGRLGYGAWRG